MNRAGALAFLVLAGPLAAAGSFEAGYTGSAGSMSGWLDAALVFGAGHDAPEGGIKFNRGRILNSTTGDAYSSVLGFYARKKTSETLGVGLGLDFGRDGAYGISNTAPDFNFNWKIFGPPGADGKRDARLKIGLDFPFVFYSMAVSTKIVTPQRRTRTAETTLRLSQFAPRLKLSVPLFGGRLLPFLSYRAYAYSQDPEEFTDAVLSRLPPGAPLAARLDQLTSGLLRRSWDIGAGLLLPMDLGLYLSWGASEAVTASTPYNTAGASLDIPLSGDFSLGAHWSRTIDASSSLDSGGASATYSY